MLSLYFYVLLHPYFIESILSLINMNIQEIKKDDLMIQVSMNFAKEDYADKVKKELNKFRREADIKGFRRGMAPISLIEKLHGQSALVESINSLVSETLNNYIQSNNLSVLGEPLPNEEKESKNEWKVGENFEFIFDIALAPKVEFTLTAEDKIPYHEVSLTAKEKKEYKENILKQYAKLENCEVAKEEDFIVGDFVQGENRVEASYVSLKSIKDEAAKGLFLGKKAGDSFQINVVEVFPNEADRAAMLKVKKEELEGINPIWDFTVKEVKNYVDAVPGEELYTQLFGADTVKSEEEFDAKLAERMSEEFQQESDYRFMLDAREYLMNKTDIKLPEEFLKRWLFVSNEGKFSMEEIEKDFQLFLKDFRWQTISQYIRKEQKLEITKEAVMDQARKLAQYQFAMYGLPNVPAEHLDAFAQNLLKDEKQGRRIYEKVEDDVVIAYVRSVITLDSKKTSIDKLRKMNE